MPTPTPSSLFPPTIYVTVEGQDTRDECLIIQNPTEGDGSDPLANVNETTDCAVYRLVSVGRIVVERSFEEDSVERSTDEDFERERARAEGGAVA